MRLLALIIICLASSAVILAQSGRNKSKQEPAQPNRPKPSIELPSSRILVKATPSPAPTPPKTNSDGDDDGEVLKVDSILVPIPVSVTDAKGNAVTNLVREDFELRVNGELQEVSDVFRSDTPVRIALMFDNSSSVMVAREFEKKAAIKFLRKVLRPNNDLAALYSVSTITRLEQGLTNDAQSLIRAIEMFPPPTGATALFDGVVEAANYLREAREGRRIIVIVSDGVDTLSDIILERDGLEKVIRAAQIADCQIYVVKTTDFENFQRTGKRGSNANLRDLAAERRMQELAAQTGGAVYSPLDERELETAFTQIAAELSQQYILSYYPNDDKRDGSFKQISLQIKSNKNLTVRTRKGYYVPKS